MALLTVSINDPTLDKKSAEVAYCLYALNIVARELGAAQGTRTSGTILGSGVSIGTAPTAMGTWTYTASASNP
jgi:hypothetical protein